MWRKYDLIGIEKNELLLKSPFYKSIKYNKVECIVNKEGFSNPVLKLMSWPLMLQLKGSVLLNVPEDNKMFNKIFSRKD